MRRITTLARTGRGQVTTTATFSGRRSLRLVLCARIPNVSDCISSCHRDTKKATTLTRQPSSFLTPRDSTDNICFAWTFAETKEALLVWFERKSSLISLGVSTNNRYVLATFIHRVGLKRETRDKSLRSFTRAFRRSAGRSVSYRSKALEGLSPRDSSSSGEMQISHRRTGYLCLPAMPPAAASQPSLSLRRVRAQTVRATISTSTTVTYILFLRAGVQVLRFDGTITDRNKTAACWKTPTLTFPRHPRHLTKKNHHTKCFINVQAKRWAIQQFSESCARVVYVLYTRTCTL